MEEVDKLIQSDLSTFPFQQEPKETSKKKAKTKESPKPRGPTAAQERAAQKLAEEEERRQTAGERHAIMRRIAQYQKDPALAARIDVKVPSDNKLDKMSLEELYAVEDTIRADLSEFGSDEMLGQLYVQGLGLAQDALPAYFPQLGLQLSGPVADLKGSLAHPETQKRLHPIIAELSIKYGRWLASGPEKRLLFFTFQLVTQVHTANTMAARMQQQVDEVAGEDITKDLDDL